MMSCDGGGGLLFVTDATEGEEGRYKCSLWLGSKMRRLRQVTRQINGSVFEYFESW